MRLSNVLCLVRLRSITDLCNLLLRKVSTAMSVSFRIFSEDELLIRFDSVFICLFSRAMNRDVNVNI